MTTRVFPAGFAVLLALALLSAGFLTSSWAQTTSPGPVTTPAVLPVAAPPPPTQNYRNLLHQFLAQLPAGLSPMQRRDAVRQYVEANFPGGLAAMNNTVATLPADSAAPGPLVIPASATPAQTAALSARHQLALALYDAKAVLRANPNLTPKQRRDYLRVWLETQGLTLWRQVTQTDQAASQENQQIVLQRRRQRLLTSDPLADAVIIAAIPIAGSLLTPAGALAAQRVLNNEMERIMTRADLAEPGQRRDAMRQWHEANEQRIDAVRAALGPVSSSIAPAQAVSAP